MESEHGFICAIRGVQMMDKHGAAAAWGVSVQWVRRIIMDAPGAKKVFRNGRALWVVPVGTPKPTATRKKEEPHA